MRKEPVGELQSRLCKVLAERMQSVGAAKYYRGGGVKFHGSLDGDDAVIYSKFVILPQEPTRIFEVG